MFKYLCLAVSCDVMGNLKEAICTCIWMQQTIQIHNILSQLATELSQIKNKEIITRSLCGSKYNTTGDLTLTHKLCLSFISVIKYWYSQMYIESSYRVHLVHISCFQTLTQFANRLTTKHQWFWFCWFLRFLIYTLHT